LGVLLEDRNGKIKGSFRAKEKKYRVDLLAKSFNGGGHACAAGFNVDSSIEEFYPKLIRTIGEHLQIVGEGRI
jgi:phosphoesterase RecJ-like protein